MKALRFSAAGFCLVVALLITFSSSSALANTIHTLDKFDSSFILYGLDSKGDTFALSSDTVVHVSHGFLSFSASVPPGWTKGLITFQLSYGSTVLTGSTSLFGGGGACQPSTPCFYFGWGVGSLPQSYSAVLTLTYGGTNGATETSDLIIAPAPEPGTLFLFSLGSTLILLAVYRSRRSPRRSERALST